MITKKAILDLKGPIIIVGAGGFIGSNLCARLLEYRSDVYGAVKNNTNKWRLNSHGIKDENLIYVDILNKDELSQYFLSLSPKTIFNLSAYGSSSFQNDEKLLYTTNILGLLNLFETSTNDCVIINTGSSSEYGFNSLKSREDDTLEPNSHYSVSKIASSYLVSFYASKHKRLTLNLRLYSIYGPFENNKRLMPEIIKNALKNKLPNLVSKNISRDFVYIDDCVEAIILSALNVDKSNTGNSYNICSGENTSLESLISLSKSIFNISSLPVWGSMEDREWDQIYWSGNPDKTKKDLKWSCKTSLKDGLINFYNWQKKIGVSLETKTSRVEGFKISAIIACYKDGEAIPEMYKRLVKVFKKLKTNYEIIFVNDCSPDNSEEIINNLCVEDASVIGVLHTRNFGSQSAFMSGMELSSGDAIVLLDGDLQDPPEIIEKFYFKWKEGFDVVFGVRVNREMGRASHLIYKLFYYIFSSLSYVKIPRNAGDFSLMDRKVVDTLLQLPEKEQFIRGLRAWVGFKQIGVEYDRPKRPYGQSTNNIFKNIWWAKKAIFSFSFQPLSFMSYLGIILTILSFFGIIIQILLRFIYPETPAGTTTIIVLVLFLGGINLLAISFVGEYVAKIFEETKDRPKFIREKIIIGKETYNTQQELINLKKIKNKKRVIKQNGVN